MSGVSLLVRHGWPEAILDKLGAGVIKAAQWRPEYHTALLLDGWLYQARLTEGVHRTRFDWRADFALEPLPWADADRAFEYFELRAGNRYDGIGLADWALRRVALKVFGRRIRPGIEDPRREFCSEFNAGQIGLSDPVQYGPWHLLRECRRINMEYAK